MSQHRPQAKPPSPPNVMSRQARTLLWGFALLGLGASVASTYVHHRLLSETGYLSFCDVNATISCTTVYTSRFGSFGGVSVALLGALWFGLVLLLLLAEARGPRSYRESAPLYLFAASGVGLGAVFYLAYASWFVVGAVCLLCVAVYVAVAGSFAVAGAATSLPMTVLPSRASRDLGHLLRSPSGVLVSILFMAGATLVVGLFPRAATPVAAAPSVTPRGLTDAERAEFEEWYESEPRLVVPVESGGAALVVVKFNDYQCPPCRQTFINYKDILARFEARYQDDFTFVTKDYPLEPECNANVPDGVHMGACEAAVAVRLARARGQAEAMEEWLFANQESLSRATVRAAAERVAGVEDFDAEYERTLEQVKADIALGHQLDVQATPTFFINGLKVQGGLQTEYFEAALTYEMERARP